jgi:hypothetical protein
VREPLAFVIAAATSTALLAGCGGSDNRTTTSSAVDAKHYVAEVNGAQQRLVSAARTIPAGNATASAWSRSLTALRSVVSKLGDDLAAIRPPASVAGVHAQLVAIVRGYAAKIDAVAGTGRDPSRLPQAKADLIAATSATATPFTASISKINSVLQAHG